MPQLLSRALACARTPSSLAQQLSRLRITPISLTQAAPISYRPNPLQRRPAPNASSKIPPAKRPLHREITPPPTLTPEALESMPYIIRRTPFAQLPIYRKWKSGGTRQVVTIKKVTGDRRVLVDELVSKLEVPPENIRINPTTGNLELKGDYLHSATEYLLERGF